MLEKGITWFCDVANLSRLETLMDSPGKRSGFHPVDPMRSDGEGDRIRIR